MSPGMPMFFQTRPGVERLPMEPLRRCIIEPWDARLAVHVVLFDDALEALALGLADDVHQLAGLEQGHLQIQIGADRLIVLETEFRDEFLGFGAGLFEMAEFAAVDARFLLRVETDLHGAVTVVLKGP